MQVITCISYHGTGSGAVDDFLKEFDNCASAPSNIECRFLQDPDGISDLEYNLIENPHRLNSGYALKRYLKFVNDTKRTYKKIFGDNWELYSKDYIEKLTAITYKGNWHGDILLLSPPKKMIYYARRAIDKTLPKKLRKPFRFDYFPKMDYLHTNISRDLFLKETQNYCQKLCTMLNPNKKDFVLLDQLVPTSNIERYLSYVKDLKVIIVDRDPRDLYINQMLLGDHVLPTEPEVFCKVFKDHRNMAAQMTENSCILKIQFEDLIFDYEKTTQKITEFVGEDEKHHKNKKGVFNPSVSVNNTKMWLTHPKYSEAAKYIETHLNEFLYSGFEK